MTPATPRVIAVVTGTRAEYGLLRWMIRDIADDPRLRLCLIVTAAHLEERFGLTCQEIEADGIPIEERVPLGLGDDSPIGIAAALGRAVEGLARALTRHQPDIVVILGDRYEMLAAATAAMICRIPIAHLHGGEITEGLIDEAIRHSITKMAHLHFVAAEPYARRVMQLGEDPKRVFLVGSPGLCALERLPLLSRAELAASLDFQLDRRFALVTYHPVTLSGADPTQAVIAMLTALEAFPDLGIIITGVNADPTGSEIEAVYQRYEEAWPERVVLVKSLGHQRYLSALREAALCLGNSSSGVIEAPALGVPTVNIGPRQRGRLKAASIIDCGETCAEINAAIARALSPDFQTEARQHLPPYRRGGASARIAAILAEVDLTDILMKHFHDLPAEVIR